MSSRGEKSAETGAVTLPETGDLLLGKYRLERSLGAGGMGVVYAAHHELLDQRVAVKLIRPAFLSHSDAIARFLNEARAAARIESEHVARVLDVGKLDNGIPFIVLEYLHGSDLAQIVAERGPLPVADVVDWLLQAIDAIACAHALGIIHRDLKPSNMFLARRPDGSSRVKVLDFGISKVTGEGAAKNITQTYDFLGTPLYMAPEQLRSSKSADQQSDVWALGVVTYELLTATTPFVAENAVELFAAIQETEPLSLCTQRSDVTPALDAVVMKCLRRQRTERYASVTELAVALAPFGTSLAERARENVLRVLPLEPPAREASTSAPHPVDRSTTSALAQSRGMPEVAATQPMPGRPVAGDASSSPAPANVPETAAPWQSDAAKPARRSGVAVGVSLGAFGALVLAVLLVGPRFAPRPTAAPTPESIPSGIAATTHSSPVVETAAIPLESAAPLTVDNAPGARPGASPKHVAAPVRKAIPSPSAAPPARANCTPPYDLDATGTKIWKRECL